MRSALQPSSRRLKFGYVFMKRTANSTIQIKGIREGLLITSEATTVTALLDALRLELPQKQAFLNGSQITLQLAQLTAQRGELKQLQALFTEYGLTLWAVLSQNAATRTAAQDLNLATRLPGSNTDLNGNVVETAVLPKSETPADAPAGDLVLRETIRSGRSIYHEGAVVIIGDVNPGAEIIAGGDVVVWGRLRGLVHAGAFGDETAVICALSLQPTQLRIADKIAISPGSSGRRQVAEQAQVRDGQIVAEAWPATK